MGSAFKNKGVQQALDGVLKYLPNPQEVKNLGYDINRETKEETEIELALDTKKPFLCLAFKLEEGRYGQLTYCRAYQGTLKKGQILRNPRTHQKYKITRMAKMHANDMEDITTVSAGDIFAIFGIEVASGDTLMADKAESNI